MGKLIIFIIIILLLISGSYYFFFAGSKTAVLYPSTETEQPSASLQEGLGASNEPAVLEQELQATELDNLDKEFADIDAQLDTALEETGR